MKWLLPLLLSLLLFSCDRDTKIGTVTGWKPVYASTSELNAITSMSAQPIVNAGKMAYAGGKVYMVERGKGVHIISYKNPAAPVKERFISIAGCFEVTIKDSYLLVNNGADLVSIDISQPQSVSVVSRIANVFTSIQEANGIPPDALNGDYFECPNTSNGMILYWEKTSLRNPECKVQKN